MLINGDAAPYLTIANDLLHSIATGRRVPGDTLPPADQLSEHYGVDLATIEDALDLLAVHCLVVPALGERLVVTDRRALGVDLTCCPSMLELDQAHLAFLGSLPMPAHELNRFMICSLEPDHMLPHADLGQQCGDTEWWVFWTMESVEIRALVACPTMRKPAAGLDEDNNFCLLFTGHSGGHSYGSQSDG